MTADLVPRFEAAFRAVYKGSGLTGLVLILERAAAALSDTKTCAYCGKPIKRPKGLPDHKWAARDPAYCDSTCSSRARWAEKAAKAAGVPVSEVVAARPAPPPVERKKCLNCPRLFSRKPGWDDAKWAEVGFCSTACGNLYRDRTGEPRPEGGNVIAAPEPPPLPDPLQAEVEVEPEPPECAEPRAADAPPLAPAPVPEPPPPPPPPPPPEPPSRLRIEPARPRPVPRKREPDPPPPAPGPRPELTPELVAKVKALAGAAMGWPSIMRITGLDKAGIEEARRLIREAKVAGPSPPPVLAGAVGLLPKPCGCSSIDRCKLLPGCERPAPAVPARPLPPQAQAAKIRAALDGGGQA